MKDVEREKTEHRQSVHPCKEIDIQLKKNQQNGVAGWSKRFTLKSTEDKNKQKGGKFTKQQI